MKPDKVVCMNCGKEINKGKWCSDACRKAFSRKSDIQPGQTNPDIQSDTDISVPGQDKADIDEFRAGLGKTDKTFYDRALKEWGEPYYDFDNDVHEGVCGAGECGIKFKTRLRLLKYCSYQHYTDTVGGRR